MDLFSKAALTVIAATLIFISAQAYQIKESLKIHSPTVAEVQALKEIKDTTKQKEARTNLYGRVPLVRVQGGFVNISGEVDCY